MINALGFATLLSLLCDVMCLAAYPSWSGWAAKLGLASDSAAVQRSELMSAVAAVQRDHLRTLAASKMSKSFSKPVLTER